MTPLRKRMIEDLRLRGYAERTVEAYTRAVVHLARFFGQSPARLTEEQVREYLLYLTTVKKVARSTHTIALCGIKFFYEQTLGRKWTVLDVARPKKEKKLPVVLSRDEVWQILACVDSPIYRVCLITIYSCGLRLTEGAHLHVPNVDGARGGARGWRRAAERSGPWRPCPSRGASCERHRRGGPAGERLP